MDYERKHHRPEWDDYFMALVKTISMRATCNRLYAGAVLVKNNLIIGTGYNGAPPGLPHCDEVGHLLEDGHCVRTIHAEHNAILQAAKTGGVSADGATLYTKYSPCVHCTKYIISCGIKRVVIGKIYRNEMAVDMFRDSGIAVDFYKENETWNKELIGVFSEDIMERMNDGEIKLKEGK